MLNSLKVATSGVLGPTASRQRFLGMTKGMMERTLGPCFREKDEGGNREQGTGLGGSKEAPSVS